MIHPITSSISMSCPPVIGMVPEARLSVRTPDDEDDDSVLDVSVLAREFSDPESTGAFFSSTP